ncbi:unnamed protein product [Prorocentrum cordatum]|uniref:Uncharacterized protein n=1 Tax=Prorocentrum cordatum TaxID=2364126 RepID=A0ABN9QYB9_9DINO|nr:unnamed protein product [Polarella glacialis]
MGRDLSNVFRHFQRNLQGDLAPNPVGRPAALSAAQVDKVVETTEAMVVAADGKYQVTALMVRNALKLKCSVKRVQEALRSRGVRFRPMREKPIRTVDDEKDRLAFGNRHAKKPPSFWVSGIHAYLDNKMFPFYPNGQGRAYAAKRAARGTYRAKGKGLAKGHVKPRRSLKVTFGKGVNVAVAISAKKVLMCHVVPKQWNAAEASTMYSKSLSPALRRAYSGKTRFLVLEDNDPSGYKSKSAVQTKVAHAIEVLPFPKRSPDINPLDYGFWDCVNRRLRKQEATYSSTKKETRAQFVARLKRTIQRVPEAILTPLVKSMGRRCKALQRAKGKDFEALAGAALGLGLERERPPLGRAADLRSLRGLGAPGSAWATPGSPVAQPEDAPAPLLEAAPRAQPAAAQPADGRGSDSSSSGGSDSEGDAAADEPDAESDADWVKEEENEQARSHVFLVTYSALLNAPEDAGMANPADMDDREFFRKALLDAVANLAPAAGSQGGRPRTRALEVNFLLTVQEKHQDGKVHYHQAVKLSHETRFLPIKTALRQRSKLASHWSTSHTELWSAVRYLTRTSDRKKSVDRSPDVWAKDGSAPNLYEMGNEGWGAKMHKRRREQAAMAAGDQVLERSAKKSKEIFGKLDLYALVVTDKLLTPRKVMTHAQKKGSLAMQNYVARNQRKLAELIEEALEWEGASERAEEDDESDWGLILRKAACTCACGEAGCEWWAAAVAFFDRNPGVDRDYLAACLVKIIKEGPSKTARVPLIVGPRNAGKSTVLEPVLTLFGEGGVFTKPKLGAFCPLAKLVGPQRRFIFFDDYRPVEYASMPERSPTVPVTDFLAMFCGQKFQVQVSQCFNNGQPDTIWKRGAAMTAKKKGLWMPSDVVPQEEIRHMQARVVQFEAKGKLKEADFRTVPKCSESFARWLVTGSTQYGNRLPRQPTASEEAQPRRASSKTAKKAANEAVNKAANEATNKASNEAANKAANKAANEAADKAANKAANEAAHEAANKAAKCANEAANEATGEAANKAANKAANEAASKVANDAANEAANEATNEAVSNAANEPARKAFNLAVSEAAKKTGSGHAADEADNEAADKAAHKAAKEAAIKAVSTAADEAAKKVVNLAASEAANGAVNLAVREPAAELAQRWSETNPEGRVVDADAKYRSYFPAPAIPDRLALELKCSVKRVQEALRSRGVRFRPMREKPIRTVDDEKDQLAFGNRHAKKPPSFWVSGIHAHLDNKMFPFYPNGQGRAYAARRAARGTYRAKGKGLAKGHVKPRRSLKVTFGKGVNVAVAISAKKVLMCHVVPKKWNAAEASTSYSKPSPALRRAYSGKSHVDATGEGSRAGVARPSRAPRFGLGLESAKGPPLGRAEDLLRGLRGARRAGSAWAYAGVGSPVAQPEDAPAPLLEAAPRAQPAAAQPADGRGSDSSSSGGSDSEGDAAADEPDAESDADWVKEEENEQARSHVFLVTYSALLNAPEDAGMANPADMDDREFFRKALLDAVANLAPAAGSQGGRPRTRALEVNFLLTVQEKHQGGKVHYHQAVKLSHETRFLPIKTALRQRSKLASHWSTSHTELWSAVRYLTRTSDRRKSVDRSPDVWAKDGPAPNLYEMGNEGWGAKMHERRRGQAAMAPGDQVLERSAEKSKDIFGKLDLYALVVSDKLLTPRKVMTYAQKEGPLAMQNYVACNQRKMAELIEEDDESDWDLILRKAACTCGGGEAGCEWWAAAVAFFDRNPGVDRDYLAACLVKIIEEGLSKTARVPLIVGPRNAGKSTVLKPVLTLFGEGGIFTKPKLGAFCLLAKLICPQRRFIFFDDDRPVECASMPERSPAVPVTDFWRCFVARSFKSKSADASTTEEIRQMQARVVQFEAKGKLKEADFRTVAKCSESFARWLVTGSTHYGNSKTAKKAANEAVNKAANEATNKASNEAANKAANKAANEAADKAANKAANEAAHEAANKAAKCANEAANEATGEAANKAANKAANEAASKVANDAANEAANEATNEAVSNAANEPARKAFNLAVSEAAKKTGSGHAADEADNEAADKAAHKAAKEAAIKAVSTAADEAAKKVVNLAASEAANGAVNLAVREPAAELAQRWNWCPAVDKVVETTEAMVVAADGKYQALKLKCSVKRVQEALRSRGVRFRPMREKPIRTVDDEKDRLAFGNRHAKKPPSFWVSGIHAYLDNKMFPFYPNGQGRAYAAKRAARGTYRAKGKGLAKGHVKPRRSLKVTFGKGVNVAVAISAKKVLMCHVVPKQWNAAEASTMYSKSLSPALRRAYSGKTRFLVLEDNDPSGYKSKSAVQTKVAHAIEVLPFPKRSPDINPLDYGFWDCVNRRLRKQEATYSSTKKETRAQFVARLKRTIQRVPEAILTPLVKSMGRRCKALQRAKGKDFEE